MAEHLQHDKFGLPSRASLCELSAFSTQIDSEIPVGGDLPVLRTHQSKDTTLMTELRATTMQTLGTSVSEVNTRKLKRKSSLTDLFCRVEKNHFP